MAGVFFFPRYSQRENFNTNNSLLLMYRLYDWSRHRFRNFLSDLLSEADADFPEIGMQLQQQVGTGTSVLDGHLFQPGIRIALEAKGSRASFSEGQLLRHLDGFGDGVGGYLLLLRPEPENLDQPKWRQLKREARERRVLLAAATFEGVIKSFRKCLREFDAEMHALVDDFEAYCSEQELLNNDNHTLFVPPCRQSLKINEAHRLYFCPAQWSRRNTRYIGMYGDKAVRFVGTMQPPVFAETIDGQLRILSDDGSRQQLSAEKAQRIRGAIAAAQRQNKWDISNGHKFYLSDDLCPTNFEKSSPGGIQGHRYIDLKQHIEPIPDRVVDLAESLRGKVWQ